MISDKTTLQDGLIAEGLADLVMQLVRQRIAEDRDHPLAIKPGQRWASAEQLAHRYGFKSARTILKRAADFGGARSHDGPGADLRFDLRKADEYWRSQQQKLAAESRPPQVTPRAPRKPKHSHGRRHRRTGRPLIDF